MNVIVEIEELVLHGFPAEWRYAVAEALEAELAAQFRVGGLSRLSNRDLDALPPLWLQLSPGGTPQEAGRLLAGELYWALEQVR